MKIQIASDLHLEYYQDPYPSKEDFRAVDDRDVLVLAGDIGIHTDARRFVEDQARISPVIYVPGNHEYYSDRTHEETDDEWRRIAAGTPGLHYLVAEDVTIGGMRFWGAPWYSDFRGRHTKGNLYLIEHQIADFHPRINDEGAWTVRRHLDEHAHQTATLLDRAGQVDVVITHWPPTRHATAPRFEDNPHNGYYVNDREDLIEEIGAQLWISGHVHDPHDALVGFTRCIGNPAGFPEKDPETEGFVPDLIVEV